MGLKYPEDLEQWAKWAASSNSLQATIRRIKSLSSKEGTSSIQEYAVFISRTSLPHPQVLVALEGSSPTMEAGYVAPAQELEHQGISTAILAHKNLENFLAQKGYELALSLALDEENIPPLLSNISEVITAGHFMSAGAWAFQRAQKLGWGYNVIQHGLMTPFAPPLPANSTLFAFSKEDAEFWISGRDSIESHVVGSQIFFEALQKQKSEPSEVNETPLFLGQMHGAELPRHSFAKAAFSFCRNHGAIYRPHPGEKDKLSTITHKLWGKLGIKIDRSNSPLNELNNPVVSVFSTGVLEAAIRGIPAWVYHPNPPAWLIEYWDRYGMNRWGSEPTPAPAQPAIEPAVQIARIIAKQLEN